MRDRTWYRRPSYRYSGEIARAAVVINEAGRRGTSF
jgi:hypothetical protein